MTDRRSDPPTYRLVVRGELGDRFGVLFDGMRLSREEGNTVLTGPIGDQAQLAGVIEKTQDLGLELILIGTVDQEHDLRPTNT